MQSRFQHIKPKAEQVRFSGGHVHNKKKGTSSMVTVIDPIVRIAHAVRPSYPDFLNQEYINTPEFVALEKMGPPEFDASKLRQWLHPRQKKYVIPGTVIHAFLLKKQMLPSCVGFVDLLGIQVKGLELFRQHFKGKMVFGWRSVVPSHVGRLCVPDLVERGGEVVLGWLWLGSDWYADDPALRFAL